MPRSLTYSHSRRQFLKTVSVLGSAALAAQAAPWVSEATALGLSMEQGQKAKLAVLGVGSHGHKLMLHLSESPLVEVVAFCDVYDPHFNRALTL